MHASLAHPSKHSARTPLNKQTNPLCTATKHSRHLRPHPHPHCSKPTSTPSFISLPVAGPHPVGPRHPIPPLRQRQRPRPSLTSGLGCVYRPPAPPLPFQHVHLPFRFRVTLDRRCIPQESPRQTAIDDDVRPRRRPLGDRAKIVRVCRKT